MELAKNIEMHRSGESFEYKGYNCRITYNGIRPFFNIDGENAESVIPSFEVTPESLGSSQWRETLMKAIDKWEGVDVESSDYIEPSKRQVVRRFSWRFISYLADLDGSWSAAVDICESCDKTFIELYDEVSTGTRELLKDNVGEGFEQRREMAYKNVRDRIC